MHEQFDTVVLELPWDSFTAGERVTREDVIGLSRDFDPGNGDPELLDWYPAGVGSAPLHLARIICQRTNLWYDGVLRRKYGYWVLGLGLAAVLFLLLVAMISGLTVESFVLGVLAPASPIIIWGLREHYRQRDAADRLERLLSRADDLWNKARTGACAEDECLHQSRQFQNAIYEHRSTTPLTFSWLYRLHRSDLERRMNRSADDMIREIRPVAGQ